MIVQPHEAQPLRAGKKRAHSSNQREQPTDDPTARASDLYEVNLWARPAANDVSLSPDALADPGASKKARLGSTRNLGPSVNHFTSLANLLSLFGSTALPFGKPLMFLEDPHRGIFVHARTYVMQWRQEIHAEQVNGAPPARSITLNAGFIHPATMQAVPLGPISMATFEDASSLLPALLMLPGELNCSLTQEEDLMTLARCMYCFDVGQHVAADAEIARALTDGLVSRQSSIGIRAAMNHAAANNDRKQVLYFLHRGADAQQV